MKTVYHLYSRDKKGKVRLLKLFVESDSEDVWSIIRFTGLLDGRLTKQPTIKIHKGLAGRTVEQQVELRVNSIINTQKDKGYVSYEDLPTPRTPGSYLMSPMNYQYIDEALPKEKTYVNGFKKVMLAKDPKPGNQYFLNGEPTAKWKERFLISKKLDGIRASIMIVDGVFHAFSRTGKSLDVAFTDIFRDLDLLRVAQYIGEDKMIDGELYIHGIPLQKIAGIVALKDYDPERTSKLQFWIFDYADDKTPAHVRARKLNTLAFMLKGGNIKVNVQHEVTGYGRMKSFHDKWVLSGFEGLIARQYDRLYGYGVRDERMLKIKEFMDDEFEITGYKLGLRGAEDMCFTCMTEDGKEFEAKPIGDRATKEKYMKDMPNLIGKMLTVKFFHYSVDGVPMLPAGVAIRNYD